MVRSTGYISGSDWHTDKISFKFSGMTLVGPDDDLLVKATFAVMVEGRKSGTVSITEPASRFGQSGKRECISITISIQNAQTALARFLDALMELGNGVHLPPVPESSRLVQTDPLPSIGDLVDCMGIGAAACTTRSEASTACSCAPCASTSRATTASFRSS